MDGKGRSAHAAAAPACREAILSLPGTAAGSWWRRHDTAIGWILWGVLILVAACLEVAGNHKTVTPAYAVGGRGWLHGDDMYDGTGAGFIYLPISGLLFLPLAAAPGAAVEILWRMMTIGSFAAAMRLSARLIERRVGSPCFAATSLVGVLLAFTAARNGQATLPMMALLVAAISAAVAGRHWTAALATTAAILMKPLALPVAAVLVVLRPRMIPPLAFGCLALVGLPFLLADAAWVHRQNAGFLEVLRISQRMQGAEAWATLFGIFNVFGCPVPAGIRGAVQVIAALGVIAGCRVAVRRLDHATASLHVCTLSVTLLLLLSPRTENNTYACIAPAIVCCMVAAAAATPPRRLAVAAGWAAVAGIVGSYEIGRLVFPAVRGVWLAPLATALLVPWFVSRLLVDLRSSTAADGVLVSLPIRDMPAEDRSSRRKAA